jgi:hypothetical protein
VRLRDSLMTAIPELDKILTYNSLSENLHHVILLIEEIAFKKTGETPISASVLDAPRNSYPRRSNYRNPCV